MEVNTNIGDVDLSKVQNENIPKEGNEGNEREYEEEGNEGNEAKEERAQEIYGKEETEEILESFVPEKDLILEDRILRNRLLIKIKKYVRRFPQHLGTLSINEQELEMKSNEELEYILKEVQFCVSVGNSDKTLRGIGQIGIQIFENVAIKFTPLKLQGYTNTLFSDQEFIDILDEVLYEYDDILYTSPLGRLGHKLFVSAIQVHGKNSMLNENNPILNEEVSAETVEKYNDL